MIDTLCSDLVINITQNFDNSLLYKLLFVNKYIYNNIKILLNNRKKTIQKCIFNLEKSIFSFTDYFNNNVKGRNIDYYYFYNNITDFINKDLQFIYINVRIPEGYYYPEIINGKLVNYYTVSCNKLKYHVVLHIQNRNSLIEIDKIFNSSIKLIL